MSYGRHSRHDHVNRLIKEALGSAEITSRLEPTGTPKLDKKRPDGISYYPFKNGWCLAWDYTCPDTLAISHIIGCRIKESTGEKRATSYLMQTIGIAIQRGNSQCILSTVKDSRKMDEVYYL